ncbi:DUF4160 domain-containing protein [Microcystis aeruginosa]|uniref:DUF4160 domain-containing protein n=1 Tax=Microcystis aeruginosa 11-30S32 TaxID=2358142 RepID=A0A510PCL5_MICAE|nr:DUF4160 domain-containing protein [Microcystis aeruginosa]GCA91491.1 DUF4160 domain-containing protein [Microcystis aeruginosa 11-30S32]
MFLNASPTATAIDLGERTVERDREIAKFWLQPVRLQSNRGFNRTEINRIQELVQENQEQLLAGWHDFFND